jgi:glycine/D-amino acid oxidase-like deaminating enzyme
VVVTVHLDAPPAHIAEEAASSIRSAHDTDATADESSRVLFSLVTAGGSSSLGSSFGDGEPDAPRVARDIVDRGARYIPAVAVAPRLAVRACARPLSLDGRPLIGRLGWCDGLWILAGHGPWGISTGPGSAALLADLMEHRVAAPPPELDPGRMGAPT